MVLEHEASETDEIFKIQDTQIQLLKAIKAETALLCKVIDSMGGRVPEAPAAPAIGAVVGWLASRPAPRLPQSAITE